MEFSFPHDVLALITEEEGRLLYDLASGKDALEIGSYNGASTICIAQSATSVVSCDNHRGDIHMGEQDSFWVFTQNLARYGVLDNVTPVIGPVEKTFMHLQGRFGFIFQDAAHDFEGCLGQLKICASLRLFSFSGVSSILAIHDYGDYKEEHFPGVKEACLKMFGREADKVVYSTGVYYF